MRVHDTVHILLTWGLTVFDSEFFTYFYAGKWSSKWWNSTNWDKASTGKSWEEVMFCTFIVYSNVRSVLETLKFGSSWLMLIEITLTYDKQNWAVEYLTCTDTCRDCIRIFFYGWTSASGQSKANLMYCKFWLATEATKMLAGYSPPSSFLYKKKVSWS